jgi:molybdate transport system substrate-binding protein
MVISARRIVLGMAAFILAAPPSSTTAAEIKALITIGVQSAIEDLALKFEKANGHNITIVYGLSALLSKRVADGEPADLFIGTHEGVDGLIKTGKISAGSDVALA